MLRFMTSSSVHHSEECYAALHDFLEDEGHSFSREIALSWSGSTITEGSRNPYGPAIDRLADVYEYGHVLAGHLRINVQLADCFLSAIECYVSSSDLCDGYTRTLRASCMHFCGFLQCNGVFAVGDINYQVLDDYCGFVSETGRFYRDCVKNVRHFLGYLVGAFQLRPALGLYLDSRYTHKCIPLDDLPTESQAAIEASRDLQGTTVSAEGFYRSIESISAQMKPFGYSDNVISYTSFYLKLLYVFLDRQGLGYSRPIADAWLVAMGGRVFTPKRVRTVRRALDLYEDLAETGRVNPLHRPRHLGSAYERLPVWCRKGVDDFLLSKKKEGRAEGTIRELRSKASIFCEFLVSEGLSSFGGLMPETVKRFSLQNEHMVPRTKNSFNGGARQFLIHMELRDQATQGIHLALPTCYAGSEKIVTVLSEEDRRRIHAYCQNASGPIGLRDAAILQLGMGTALRACDILALKIDDINWTERTIRVIQRKTRMEHNHSVDVRTLNAVFRYLRDARPKNTVSDTIFVSVRAPYAPLTSSVCNDALIRSGSSVSDFHRLRRTYATDSIAGGATLEEAAELLGQSDTRSLHRYASLDNSRMHLCPLSLEETGLTMERRRHNE